MRMPVKRAIGFCPEAATRPARWRSRELPGGGRGIYPGGSSHNLHPGTMSVAMPDHDGNTSLLSSPSMPFIEMSSDGASPPLGVLGEYASC